MSSVYNGQLCLDSNRWFGLANRNSHVAALCRRPCHPLDHRAVLRVPRQLGYKSVKYITRITVTENPKLLGEGLGSASSEDWHGSDNRGYAWYAGI